MSNLIFNTIDMLNMVQISTIASFQKSIKTFKNIYPKTSIHFVLEHIAFMIEGHDSNYPTFYATFKNKTLPKPFQSLFMYIPDILTNFPFIYNVYFALNCFYIFKATNTF